MKLRLLMTAALIANIAHPAYADEETEALRAQIKLPEGASRCAGEEAGEGRAYDDYRCTRKMAAPPVNL